MLLPGQLARLNSVQCEECSASHTHQPLLAPPKCLPVLLVLASQSPRRQELLQQCLGIRRFACCPSTFDEDYDKRAFASPAAYCTATARAKAVEVMTRPRREEQGRGGSSSSSYSTASSFFLSLLKSAEAEAEAVNAAAPRLLPRLVVVSADTIVVRLLDAVEVKALQQQQQQYEQQHQPITGSSSPSSSDATAAVVIPVPDRDYNLYAQNIIITRKNHNNKNNDNNNKDVGIECEEVTTGDVQQQQQQQAGDNQEEEEEGIAWYEIMEKADTPATAAEMIRKLQGRTHTVITALVVASSSSSSTPVAPDVNVSTNDDLQWRLWEHAEHVDVTMAPLSEAHIAAYSGVDPATNAATAGTASNNTPDESSCSSKNNYRGCCWYGKAGAYGIQDVASSFITSIRGDYYAVMGLPVHALAAHLADIL